MIPVGQRVRHRKQPGWGVGRVTAVGKSGALVELVIVFADSERKLRLKPEMVTAMIEVLTAEQNAAVDAEEAEAKRTARAEARQRSRGNAAKKKTARLRQELHCLTLSDDREGHAVVAIQEVGNEVLRWLAGDGETVEDIALPPSPPNAFPAPTAQFVPTDLVDDGRGTWIGTRTHAGSAVVFARRGQRARMWLSPVESILTRATPWPGVGALVYDLHRVVLAREHGDATVLPLALAGRTVGSARSWGDGILVGLHGPDNAAEYFSFVYVGVDGTIRFEGVGGEPTPIDDELMIAFDRRGVQAIDRNGVATGRLDVPVVRGDERRDSFTRFDDELVFALAGEISGLVRWHPRVDQPRWTSHLSKNPESLVQPVRVGRFVAVTSNVYAEPESPRVWVVDAETGALEHAFEIKKPPMYLLPVGDDALVAVAFSKQPIAWRGLASESPERFLLVHPSECSDAVSPAPNVVITKDGGAISYFDL